jgi:hypothetical protein
MPATAAPVTAEDLAALKADFTAQIEALTLLVNRASARAGIGEPGIGVTPLPRRESRPNPHALKALAGGAR